MTRKYSKQIDQSLGLDTDTQFRQYEWRNCSSLDDLEFADSSQPPMFKETPPSSSKIKVKSSGEKRARDAEIEAINELAT